MTVTPLCSGWTLRLTGGPAPAGIGGRDVDAAVPGCVTTDLLRAGLIKDPYLDRNEAELTWIGRCDWRYRTRFDAGPRAVGERTDLVFEGLDTVARIELNAVHIGSTANMHRSWRFDVSHLLRPGSNELTVTLAAPLTAAETMSRQLGERPRTLDAPFNAIRKMACSFGWDWGPALPTSGIWRPVGIERWRHARIAGVRPLIRVGSGDGVRAGAVADVHVDLERDPDDDAPLLVRAQVGSGTSGGGWLKTAVIGPETTSAVLPVDVPDVALWWPAGYGPQPLYDLTVEVRLAGREEVLDRWQRRIGFRTVELDTTPDQAGTPLGVVINGQPIAVRGANWIPADCFISRVGREDYLRGLRDAVEANMNLIRVWGGGIYESDAFYDAADELGLLVWQDFLFACAAYAEEEPLRTQVAEEARQAVTRLCPHPSLAVWNGNNENLLGYQDWGWQEPLGGRTWGAGYYFDLLPAIVSELDPTRPYSAGSPWSFGADAHPNDPRHGSMHVWDVWNSRDYTAYRDHRPRFVAEFGFQGPPAWATLTRAITARPLLADSPVLRAHQKAADGMHKLSAGLRKHLPEPRDAEDWHWATSLNQARAVAFGIEHWRSITPRCQGIVVWQLNDCWPVISWSAVDGDGRRKPLWYALRRSYADRLLTIQPTTDGLAVVAVNDGRDHWAAALPVQVQTFDGEVLAKDVLAIEAAPGQVAVLPLPAALTAGPRDQVVIIAGEGTSRALWFHQEDNDLLLPEPALRATAEHVPGGYQVTVRAPSLQRDISLLADKAAADAVVDDMLITLLAGEEVTFRVRTGALLDAADLCSPRVLRSANQLARAGR